MARFENKYMKRDYNPLTGKDIYTPERGKSFDLSDVRFLYSGVDTIRQLFICDLIPDVLVRLENCKENNLIFEFGGIDWKVSGGGKKTGYQYILKNLDSGFVFLVKSFYVESDARGSHIKVEATPQVIHELGLVSLSNEIRRLANCLANTVEASGVAVHLYTDVKGLVLSDDFEQKLATRSKRNLKVNGIGKVEFNNASASFIYNKNETFMFGMPSGLQMCLYNKSIEAVKSDKIAFCEKLWKTTPSIDDILKSEYKDGSDGSEVDTVHRLEFRVHHSIIKEFENGNFSQTGKTVCIREAKDLINHLGGLWRYCLDNFRYQESRTYVHPLWQKFFEDVKCFNVHDTFVYKRAQKKSTANIMRNVGCYIGNYLRLAARRRLSVGSCVKHFMNSSLERELHDYFGLLQFNCGDDLERVLWHFCEKKINDHILNGVAV